MTFMNAAAMPIQSALHRATINTLPGRSYGPTFSHNQIMPAKPAPDRLQRNTLEWSDSSGGGIGDGGDGWAAGAAKIAGGDGCAAGADRVAGGDGCAAGVAKIAGGAWSAVGEKFKASKSSSHCRQNRNAPNRGVPQRGQNENAMLSSPWLACERPRTPALAPAGRGPWSAGPSEPVTPTE
jgi:hypothetical protein